MRSKTTDTRTRNIEFNNSGTYTLRLSSTMVIPTNGEVYLSFSGSQYLNKKELDEMIEYLRAIQSDMG